MAVMGCRHNSFNKETTGKEKEREREREKESENEQKRERERQRERERERKRKKEPKKEKKTKKETEIERERTWQDLSFQRDTLADTERYLCYWHSRFSHHFSRGGHLYCRGTSLNPLFPPPPRTNKGP